MDTKEFSAWVKGIQKIAPKAYKQAVRGTLNGLDFEARKQAAEQQLPNAFTLRNQFAQKTVQYSKAKGSKIHTMQSEVGQVAKIGQTNTSGFLAIQDTGGIIRPKRGQYLPKATQFGCISKKYSRPVAKRFSTGAAKIFTLKLKSGEYGKFVRTGKKHESIKMVYSLEYRRQNVRASRWLQKSAKYATARRRKIFHHEMDRALAKNRIAK